MNDVAFDFGNGKVVATIKFSGTKANSNPATCHHIVTIKNLDTKKSARFDYWSSLANPNAENREGLLDALTCMSMDASSVNNTNSFEDFALDFGYDTDSREAERIYKACIKNAEKLDRVFGDSEKFIDKMVEIENKGITKILSGKIKIDNFTF